MTWLKALYAEQSSPDEVVIFLLLSTFAILVIAFVAYAVILLILSRWRMDDSTSVFRLLFPSLARVRKYSAEYTLGALTALLLALTVYTKHDTVTQILEQDISEISYHIVRSALPQGDLSKETMAGEQIDVNIADSISGWLSDGTAMSVGIQAEAVVQPLLKAGMADSASSIVHALVDAFDFDTNRNVSQEFLFWSAISLLVGYVLWFSIQRWLEFQRHKVTEPNYAVILKRLSLPAVCISLLFASAVAHENTDRLENSIMDRLNVAPTNEEKSSTEVSLGEAIISQANDPESQSVDIEDIEELNAKLSELSSGLAELDRRTDELRAWQTEADRALAAMGEQLRNDANQVQSLSQALDDLRVKLGGFETELVSMIRQIDEKSSRALAEAERVLSRLAPMLRDIEHHKRQISELARLAHEEVMFGVLLVENQNGNQTYSVSSTNRRRSRGGTQRGSRIGIHLLPPGSYAVSGNSAVTERVGLSNREAEHVRLRPQPLPPPQVD